jgi:multiple sugar transport system ATP-binding protein
MAFGLKMRKLPKDEIQRRVEKSAKSPWIENLLKRKPA